MSDDERILVVMYAWHLTGAEAVDFEELGFVGRISPQGIATAEEVIARDADARALFERIKAAEGSL